MTDAVDRETEIRARSAEILAQQPTAAELEEMEERRERNRRDAIMARVTTPPAPAPAAPAPAATRSPAATHAYVDRQVANAFRAFADRLVPMVVAHGKTCETLAARLDIVDRATDARLRSLEPKPRIRVAAASRAMT